MRLSDIVGSMGHTSLPVIATFLFLAAFAAVLVRTFRAGPERVRHDAQLPLQDDR